MKYRYEKHPYSEIEGGIRKVAFVSSTKGWERYLSFEHLRGAKSVSGTSRLNPSLFAGEVSPSIRRVIEDRSSALYAGRRCIHTKNHSRATGGNVGKFIRTSL